MIFAALTTMIGFISFIFGSYLSIIEDFGIFHSLFFSSYVETWPYHQTLPQTFASPLYSYHSKRMVFHIGIANREWQNPAWHNTWTVWSWPWHSEQCCSLWPWRIHKMVCVNSMTKFDKFLRFHLETDNGMTIWTNLATTFCFCSIFTCILLLS